MSKRFVSSLREIVRALVHLSIWTWLAILTLLGLAAYGKALFVYLFGPGATPDLLLSISVGVLTGVPVILEGRKKDTGERRTFYICGVLLILVFSISGVRGYLAALRTRNPEDIVNEAVGKALEGANKHTDEQIGGVNDAIKRSDDGSKAQIEDVRKDVRGLKGDVQDLVTQATTDISDQISKVDPSTQKRVELRATLWPNSDSKLPQTRGTVKKKDGKVTVYFTVQNMSDDVAEDGDIWVIICAECTYASEPKGYTRLQGMDQRIRWQHFNALNAGAYFERQEVEFTPEYGAPVVDIGVKTACRRCPKLTKDSWQLLSLAVEN